MASRKVRVDRQRLEALMALRGVSNESLADSIGKHYNSILRIKQEQSTTFDTLELLCDRLECHPFDLIVAEGYPAPFLAAPASH
jgi:DNA-binding Xre family transcriptional regulator